MGWGGKPSTKGLWCFHLLLQLQPLCLGGGCVRSRCDVHVQQQQEAAFWKGGPSRHSGSALPPDTQALPSHPPPEVQAARGLRRCLAHPCHLPPLQPAGAVWARAPDPLACFTRVGAELSCELLMVHQEGQELNRQQHAGQRCLWAQALRQHPEHALEPKTQGPRKT